MIAGIWPLTSVRNAEFMKNELRVSVPDEILSRMAKANTPEAAREEGVAIAREMLAQFATRCREPRSARRWAAMPRRLTF